jgi:hypothetical protein
MERKRIEKMKLLAIEIQKHFKNFYLSGETALMIKHKHRISEDLDFFSKKEFSFTKLASKVKENFKVQKEERFEDNIDFIIEDIKVSFIFFPMDFERKFPHQSFEIYLGAVFSIEDYPELDKKTIKIIKEVMKEWKV